MTAATKEARTQSETSRAWLGRAAFEAGLILFAVILGFLVTEWREEAGERAEAQAALQRILNEVRNNRDSMARVLPYHEDLLQKLRERAETPSGKPMIDELFAVADNGIGDLILQDEAWRLALNRGTLRSLPFDEVREIAVLYRGTELGAGGTWRMIVQALFDDASFAPDPEGIQLKRLIFIYETLVSQERYAVARYTAVLENYGADTPQAD